MRPTVILALSAVLIAEVQLSAASNLWSIGRSNNVLKSRRFPNVDPVIGITGDNRKSVIPDDLTRLIAAPCGAKSKEHAKAMELLESMRSAPTCNKLATSNLLSSCQSIEGFTPDHGPSLDGLKAAYAAQLALCELRNVGAEPPEQCRSMVLDDGISDLDLHSAELRGCLRSLESRPQWWTSYSNNIQNAVIMCRAARVEIEKDEMIKIMKVMLSTSAKVDETFENVLRTAKQEVEQQQNIASAVHAFQEQLLQDLETTSQKGQNYISTLTASLGASIQSMLKAFAFASEDMQINMNDLSLNLKATSEGAWNINKSVTQIFQQILHGSSKLASLQANELEANKALSSDLQQSLRSMRDEDVAGISDFLRNLHHDLRLSGELLANNSVMLREHVSLSQELGGPTKIVNSVSRWTWLILTVFALWIYNARAGALLTIITIIFMSLVDTISPGQPAVIILQLTSDIGISLIDFFQGLGILLSLAFPLASLWRFLRRGGKLVNLLSVDEQPGHCCSHCKKALQPTPHPSKQHLSSA